jgi:hypothetical protein
MIRRSKLLCRFGLLLVFAACVSTAWSQIVRRKDDPSVPAKPAEPNAAEEGLDGFPERIDPELEVADPNVRSATVPNSKTDKPDPDFEVIRPLLPTVVTIRWTERHPQRVNRSAKTRAGVVVDPRGYILTLPFDADPDDDEFENEPIKVLFYEGTECVADIVDTDRSRGMTLLKVELPRPYPSIDPERIRDATFRSRVFVVPQQLRKRMFKGRISSTSVNFGNSNPTLILFDIRIPKNEGGSLLVDGDGAPIGLCSEMSIGSPNSYALPLTNAKSFIAEVVPPARNAPAANRKEDAHRSTLESDTVDTPVRINRVPGRSSVTPETMRLVEELEKVEILAAEDARIIRDFQSSRDPAVPAKIAENRRLLNEHLKKAFDLKVRIEEMQLEEFRSRLDRIAHQIGRRKALRDRIIRQRAAELISAPSDTDWNSPGRIGPPLNLPDAGSPDGDSIVDDAQKPDGPRRNRSNSTLPGRAGRNPRPVDPSEVDFSPPHDTRPRGQAEIRETDTLQPNVGVDQLPRSESDSPDPEAANVKPVANAGAMLTVHLRREDKPQEAIETKNDYEFITFVGIVGKSLNYDSNQYPVQVDPRSRARVFGSLRPGHYSLTVQLADGRSMTRPVTIRGDKPVELTVICPAQRKPATVLATLPAVPKEFLERGVQCSVQCSVEAQPIRVDGFLWQSDTKNDQIVVFNAATGKPSKIFRTEDNVEIFNDVDLEKVEDDDRVLFLTSGPVAVTVAMELSWRDERGSYFVPSPLPRTKDVRTVLAGENVWKLQLPEDALKKMQDDLSHRKADIQSHSKGEPSEPKAGF